MKKLAVWKFASCDGCQLTLLDLEDELLRLSESIDIAYFPEASSAAGLGPYDLSLVEGSITTPSDAQRILKVREQSRYLVTLGACATAGGIQALRNFSSMQEFMAAVYASPHFIKTLDQSLPISHYVPVDYELRGCPIHPGQLLEVMASFLAQKNPAIPNESVCCACKRQGEVCLLVAKGQPCLGPVTHAGCGALCPRYGRGCYGCYGPKEHANMNSLSQRILAAGERPRDLKHILRNFNAAAPDFAAESMKYES